MTLETIKTDELAKKIVEGAKDKNAEELAVLDMRGITTLADYFVICNGTSTPHVRAIFNSIEDNLQEEEIEVLHKEGTDENRWVVLDYADVIVHVFHKEERELYNLEKLWGDAEEVAIEGL
ncbi:ribosome silencing factor [Halanaerocella petrolearia]